MSAASRGTYNNAGAGEGEGAVAGHQGVSPGLAVVECFAHSFINKHFPVLMFRLVSTIPAICASEQRTLVLYYYHIYVVSRQDTNESIIILVTIGKKLFSVSTM